MTKGQVEQEITSAMVAFQRNLTGHGPASARTYIVEDMVLIRMQGMLSPLEQHLVQREDGRKVVKDLRHTLREITREDAEAVIRTVTGCEVLSSHGDVSTRTGERVEIYVLEGNLEMKLRGHSELLQEGRTSRTPDPR